MSAAAGLLAVWVGTAIAMAALWEVQRRLGEAEIVDLGWAAGLGLAAAFHALVLRPGVPFRRWLVAVMVLLWSARLCAHLAPRVVTGGEDARYRALRARWGDRAQARLFLFFQLQGLSVALLSGHFLLAMRAPGAGPRIWDLVGLGVWAVAIGGEAIADRQLRRFRADPARQGRVCRVGLWRYSRHPNYFFEWLHWLAYVPIAVGTAWFPAAFLAPAAMLVLMRFVTGIPPAEAQALRSRGEAYRRYQRTTSAFVPWPPRREAEEVP